MDQHSSLRILVVDDHKGFRESLVSFLREITDVDVVGEAADGVEAEQMAQKLTPDVVIMDIKMPRLNGIEAAGRIKNQQPSVSVILYSMHDPEVRDWMAFNAAYEFIPKQRIFEEIVPLLERIRP